jgi:peptidoglycan/xylan/chitin deacetylase (PgdA/CDA1 family)
VLLRKPIAGANIPGFPAKTICLTYDDGPGENGGEPSAPGPHSLELARYLASQGAQATFFVVGRHLQQHPEIGAEICALGHQLGVHTYDHLNLETYYEQGGDVVRQTALTSALMPKSAGLPYYFRPPYGGWSPQLAEAMNADFLVRFSSFGPIHWDCDGRDWEAWKDGKDADPVAHAYEVEIEKLGKGIVLMHDSIADLGHTRDRNRALALTRILVPRLKQKGYSLIRLDSIARLASRAAAPEAIALRSISNGRYVSCPMSAGAQITVSGAGHGPSEKLTVAALGSNRFAFRAPCGKYLSAPKPGFSSSISASADTIGDWEIFDAMPFPGGKVAFRAFPGGFLTAGNGEPPELALNGANGTPESRSVFSFFVFP